MLVVTDNPLAEKQRGNGFYVGQRVFLSDTGNTVRAAADVQEVIDGIAQLTNMEVFRQDDLFEATGDCIKAIAVGDTATSLRKIRSRQQQFRVAVLARSNNTCALSGCNVPEALEAAHLPGKSWESGHNLAEDGIALRADLHRLLDAGLMIIGLDGTVSCSLDHYQWLNGRQIT